MSDQHDLEICKSEDTETKEAPYFLDQTISSNVRRIMLERGLSQRDLAKKMGCTDVYVNQILNPTRKRGIGKQTLEKLAEVFAIEPRELLMPLEIIGTPEFRKLLNYVCEVESEDQRTLLLRMLEVYALVHNGIINPDIKKGLIAMLEMILKAK
ncbi:MAG: helix-turn-helix domain-containing protein [Desulfobacteraceae bacterium]